MPTPRQSDFYERIDPDNLYPLWEAIDELQSAVPLTDATPHVWRFDDIRPRLLEAADLISAEAADRRRLLLENRWMRGRRRITEALYTGLQCIMPGEVAKPHRHTPSAMRMVIESEGAHSEVDGEPVDQYADSHQLSVRQQAELLSKVARVVGAAHVAFKVHRDLKPNNILVTQDGSPKVIDFGIASVIGDLTDELIEQHMAV